MCNRIDSTTDLLKRMFLHCRASDNTIMYKSDSDDCRMCNTCRLVERCNNYAIFQFEFDSECLQYKFDFEVEQLKGIQKIVGITFIGFCD